MPTSKERINLTVDDSMFALLGHLAAKKHLAVAAYTRQLVEKALELEEDRYFSTIADERLSKSSSRAGIDHDTAWR
jgi:predicted DNA-binding protein